MSAQPATPFVTPEQYLDIERAADFKSEYISGEMIAMAGATRRHERLVANLAGMLYNALRGSPGEPHGGNLRVRVRQTNYLYPDFTVICGEPELLARIIHESRALPTRH